MWWSVNTSAFQSHRLSWRLSCIQILSQIPLVTIATSFPAHQEKVCCFTTLPAEKNPSALSVTGVLSCIAVSDHWDPPPFTWFRWALAAVTHLSFVKHTGLSSSQVTLIRWLGAVSVARLSLGLEWFFTPTRKIPPVTNETLIYGESKYTKIKQTINSVLSLFIKHFFYNWLRLIFFFFFRQCWHFPLSLRAA